jgi:hypothetical protein
MASHSVSKLHIGFDDMPLRLVSILLLVLFSSYSFVQGDDVPQEYLVKAKFLLNIPAFTELPNQSSGGTSYNICIMGDTPIEKVLVTCQGKLIKKRPLVVRKINDLSQTDNCQILFIASSERHRLQTLLPEVHRRGILTISDMRDFAHLGGIFSMLMINKRITYDLNRASAGKARISFSTHLLKLAHDIIN